MKLNSEWIELLSAFNAARIRYLVVGGHAFSAHAEPRFTGDLDLWIEPTPKNAERVWKALSELGQPLGTLKPVDLTDQQTVFQMGEPPNRADILAGISKGDFKEAWASRVRGTLGGVPVNFIGRKHLIQNKRAAGRPKDLLDVAELLKSVPAIRDKKKPRKRKRRRPT